MRYSQRPPPRTWDLSWKICQPRAHRMTEMVGVGCRPRTIEYCAVGSEKAVLKGLLVFASLECLLARDDVVDVLAGVEGHLVATMAVEDAEERELLGVVLGLGRAGEEV